MSVAYIVMAHKAPMQVARQIKMLSSGDSSTSFFIHVDRKSPPSVASELVDQIRTVANCEFLQSRRVRWGHWSQIAVSLEGLRAVERSGHDPEQVVLVTGQHYPIRPHEEIVERLSDPTIAFMQRESLPNYQWWPTQRGGLDRFERVWVWTPRRGNVMLPLLRKRLPDSYEPWGGSAYWSLGRQHRRRILQAAGERDLTRCFRHSGSGDEVFFQTVLMSSALRESVVNDSLVFAVWDPAANNPKTLTVEDVADMERSGKLFARKVDSGVDSNLLDEIDARLLGNG